MQKIFENWRGYINEQSAATVGDLVTAVENIRKAKSKEEIKQKAKAIGGTVGRFMLGIVTAGLSETVSQAVDTAEAIKDVFVAATDPETISSGKLQNQVWVQLLGIDDKFSRIVDNKIEKQILTAMISKYTGDLARMQPNAALPNFTNLMAKKINRLYLKDSPLSVSKKD